MQAYPVIGKRKSSDMCEAFIRGAEGGGGDAAVFYGVDESNLSYFEAVKASGRDFYYIDNSYFDISRGTHFRITRNGIQHSGQGATNGARLRALGIAPKPWRHFGRHLVVCPQSESFMRCVIGHGGDWLEETLSILRASTSRLIRVRDWNRDKMKAAATLPQDLRGAWLLVTHSSAAAITALIEGIPVISQAGAAAAFSGRLDELETPPLKTGRERFLGVLADNQFTPHEISRGIAWRMLSDVG